MVSANSIARCPLGWPDYLPPYSNKPDCSRLLQVSPSDSTPQPGPCADHTKNMSRRKQFACARTNKLTVGHLDGSRGQMAATHHCGAAPMNHIKNFTLFIHEENSHRDSGGSEAATYRNPVLQSSVRGARRRFPRAVSESVPSFRLSEL